MRTVSQVVRSSRQAASARRNARNVAAAGGDDDVARARNVLAAEPALLELGLDPRGLLDPALPRADLANHRDEDGRT